MFRQLFYSWNVIIDETLKIKQLEKSLPLGSDDKCLSEKIKNYFKCIKNGQDLDKDGVINETVSFLRKKI